MEKRSEILLIAAIIIIALILFSTPQFSDLLNKLTGKTITGYATYNPDPFYSLKSGYVSQQYPSLSFNSIGVDKKGLMYYGSNGLPRSSSAVHYEYFDLSSIPSGATITSATLYLYHDSASIGTDNNDLMTPKSLPTTDRVTLGKLTEDFTEADNYNSLGRYRNQEITNKIDKTNSTAPRDDILIYDVKDIVQGWVSDSSSNHGFVFLGNYNNNGYASTTYYFKNAPEGYKPKLVLSYTTTSPTCTPDNTVNCVNKQCGIFTNWTGAAGTTTCGQVGCGIYNNGSCSSGQNCNLTTYQCVACTTQTCAQLGKQCGMWDNTCGTSINCTTTPLVGGCISGKVCDAAGQCVNCAPSTTDICAGKQCTPQGQTTIINGTCGYANCGNCPSGQNCNSTYQCTTCQPNWERKYNTTCSNDIITTYALDSNNCNVAAGMPQNLTNYKDCDANGLIGTLDDIDYNLRGKTLSVDIDGVDADDSEDYSDMGTVTVEIYSGTKKIIEFEWDFDHPLNLYNIYIEKQDSSEKKGYLLIKGIEADKTVWVDKKNSTSTNICIEDETINSIGDISNACSQDDEVDISCPSSDDDEYSCDIDSNYFEVAYLSHSGVKEIAAYSSSTCTSNCAGKECGSNGCGGTCSPGCSSGETCTSGQCTGTCIPSCTGKECGTNGCTGSCGSCSSGETCSSGQCVACTPDWECGDWSTCTDGKQTKTCTDNNDCGTTTNKPAETQSCGSSLWIYIVVIILIVLIVVVIIIIYFYMKKKKPQQTPQIKFPTIQSPQSNTRYFPPSNQPRFK